MKLLRPTAFPVSQGFGQDPTYYSQIRDSQGNPLQGHNGIDYACPIGTPIKACHDGVVWFAGWMPDRALQVEILSDGTFDYKGEQCQYKTSYAHLSTIQVNNGQKVKQGDIIGLSGNTGKYTTGAHLHLGFRPIKNYMSADPANGYDGCIDPSPYIAEAIFSATSTGKTEMIQTSSTAQNPSPKPFSALPEHARDFLRAILRFQLAENINDFKSVSDLRKIKIGQKTLNALKKFQL